MINSLCETCQRMREVFSGKGSRFLLCELALSESDYPKYPAQPVVRCRGYLCKEFWQSEEAAQES